MTSSLRRLASDHAALHKLGLPPYYLLPATSSANPDDLTQLHILLTGPPGTPYEDGLWRLQLRMPSDYPKNPPKAFFRTKIWHPNVDESTGSVCLDTLKRDWESKLTLRDILVTISCLLINPNPDSALNAEAGRLLQENWDEFAKHAKLMSSIHAKIPAGQREAAMEARSRGEESENADTTNGPTKVESEDEEENTKENDHSLNLPMRGRRPDLSIRRPTVLGKRPLADLPVPPEPPSDDEDELTSSARNIAANTPNLSNSLANISFDSSMPVWAVTVSKAAKSTPKLSERQHSINTNTQRSDAGPCNPPAKRPCPGARDGKENVSEKADVRSATLATAQSAAASIGLGVKTQTHTQPSAISFPARKPAGSAGPNARQKPRIGMRRL